MQLALLRPFRKHCGSGGLGECPAITVRAGQVAGGKPLGPAQAVLGLQGTSHPSLQALAPARGRGRETFQGHSNHLSTVSWATTSLLTPTFGNPLVQVTTWGPAMFPSGPNFAIAPFKSLCLSPYMGEGELLEGRSFLQRCGVEGRAAGPFY